LVFYFICCIKKYFQIFALLKFSWIKNSSQMLYFLQMYDDSNVKNNFLVSANLLAQKTIGKKNIFSIFWLPTNVFKRGDFGQFLASKIYGKIWHCFKIFCNFYVSENFGMSPVLGAY